MSSQPQPDFPAPDDGTEPIRRAATSIAEEGALVVFGGPGARDHSVETSVFSDVFSHVTRLIAIARARAAGVTVEKRGPIWAPKGIAPARVGALQPGSLIVPVRLDLPDGQTELAPHAAVGPLVETLAKNARALDTHLMTAPEREGDEIVALAQVLVDAQVDLTMAHVIRGEVRQTASIGFEAASGIVGRLGGLEDSDPVTVRLSGTLFRVDTNKQRLSIDVEGSSDTDSNTVTAGFSLGQLETVRAALRKRVTAELLMVEQRRPYERSARARVYSLESVTIAADQTV